PLAVPQPPELQDRDLLSLQWSLPALIPEEPLIKPSPSRNSHVTNIWSNPPNARELEEDVCNEGHPSDNPDAHQTKGDEDEEGVYIAERDLVAREHGRGEGSGRHPEGEEGHRDDRGE